VGHTNAHDGGANSAACEVMENKRGEASFQAQLLRIAFSGLHFNTAHSSKAKENFWRNDFFSFFPIKNKQTPTDDAKTTTLI
jgi:hypothetical protein